MRLPALMYHSVSGRQGLEAPGGAAARYDVRWEALAAQLNEIARARMPTVLPGEGSGPGVVITFDDSWASHEPVACEMIAPRGMRAVFFLSTGEMGGLDWGAVGRMRAAGMTIGSHGVSHRPLAHLGPDDLRAELVDSRRAIEDATGSQVDLLSLPGGSCSPAVLEAAGEAGYAAVFGSTPGLTDRGSFLWRRLAVLSGTSTRTVRGYLRGNRLTLLPRWIGRGILAPLRAIRHRRLARRD